MKEIRRAMKEWTKCPNHLVIPNQNYKLKKALTEIADSYQAAIDSYNLSKRKVNLLDIFYIPYANREGEILKKL